MEVLKDRKSESIRLAPLFDHGLSFFFSCTDDQQIKAYDVMADRPVQCFVGSRSAMKNLSLIPKKHFPDLHPLQESDKDFILSDLNDVVSKVFQETIWKMIWERWQYYEDFCNQR